MFDILLAEGEVQEDAEAGASGASGVSASAADIDEVVRDAVRNSIAPCPPPSEVKAGNLTVGHCSTGCCCLVGLWFRQTQTGAIVLFVAFDHKELCWSSFGFRRAFVVVCVPA